MYTTVHRYEVAFLLMRGHPIPEARIAPGDRLVSFSFPNSPKLQEDRDAFEHDQVIQDFISRFEQTQSWIRREQDHQREQRSVKQPGGTPWGQ